LIVPILTVHQHGDHFVEVVERKGLGHPDTICDALAETFSRNLCREYRRRFYAAAAPHPHSVAEQSWHPLLSISQVEQQQKSATSAWVSMRLRLKDRARAYAKIFTQSIQSGI
jgi:hypothetical protein